MNHTSLKPPADAATTHYFVAGSPLADVLDGFAPRAGQAEMAAAVAAAIDTGDNLVVEAGTGTGKTLAYLVPALLSGRRVIISTGTKTLQDQLFHRDLPSVCGALGRPAKTVLLKGRANYLCLQRMTAAHVGGVEAGLELQAIQRWSQATATGDRAELAEIQEDSPIWPKVTSTVENCLGAKCDFYSRCHVVTARQAAMEADIVVVNHHLLLADLVLKEEGFGELLPGVEAVVVDEAHQFPDVAQAFFNKSVSSRSLQNLAEDLRNESLAALPPAAKAVALADALLRVVADIRIALPRPTGNVQWDEVVGSLEPRLDELVLVLDDVLDWLSAQDEQYLGLRKCRERTEELSERLAAIMNGDITAGLRWLGLTLRGFGLNYTPVEVSANLQALLERYNCAWVFTSATLAVGDNFDHFLLSSGLNDPRTLSIPSPFDYAANSLLLLPENLPTPDSANYTQQVVKLAEPLLQASRGRAFVLFTSHRALRQAAELLRASPDFNLPLLVQGEAPRSRLLDEFVALPDPVLLGTSSFWEGVDIRGQALQLVIIDKLPFASPGDPFLKARLAAIRQRGGNPFAEYQLPQAILGLKQGVGRLIRDAADRGVVVVCDPRLQSRSYGRQFLRSLPPFKRTNSVAAASELLRS